jgi:REP element-mobilizing transposase RayT
MLTTAEVSMTDNKNYPKAYLITFNTYGSWLHGDDRGSTQRRPVDGESGRHLKSTRLREYRRELMTQAPMVLTTEQQQVVSDAIIEECTFRNWDLLEHCIEDKHCHIAVSGQKEPEEMMRMFKATATRKLREQGMVDKDRKVWARHGSTRYLWTEVSVGEACKYVQAHRTRRISVSHSAPG